MIREGDFYTLYIIFLKILRNWTIMTDLYVYMVKMEKKLSFRTNKCLHVLTQNEYSFTVILLGQFTE